MRSRVADAACGDRPLDVFEVDGDFVGIERPIREGAIELEGFFRVDAGFLADQFSVSSGIDVKSGRCHELESVGRLVGSRLFAGRSYFSPGSTFGQVQPRPRKSRTSIELAIVRRTIVFSSD